MLMRTTNCEHWASWLTADSQIKIKNHNKQIWQQITLSQVISWLTIAVARTALGPRASQIRLSGNVASKQISLWKSHRTVTFRSFNFPLLLNQVTSHKCKWKCQFYSDSDSDSFSQTQYPVAPVPRIPSSEYWPATEIFRWFVLHDSRFGSIHSSQSDSRTQDWIVSMWVSTEMQRNRKIRFSFLMLHFWVLRLKTKLPSSQIAIFLESAPRHSPYELAPKRQKIQLPYPTLPHWHLLHSLAKGNRDHKSKMWIGDCCSHFQLTRNTSLSHGSAVNPSRIDKGFRQVRKGLYTIHHASKSKTPTPKQQWSH